MEKPFSRGGGEPDPAVIITYKMEKKNRGRKKTDREVLPVQGWLPRLPGKSRTDKQKRTTDKRQGDGKRLGGIVE